jgi:DMSO/TMAO reductase YedYZ molybdopterin-dependent catalytic subunit
MRSRFCALLLLLLPIAFGAHAEGKVKLDHSSRYQDIVDMDPNDVDPSGLPLTSVSSLHTTGTPHHVDEATWRLEVDGKAAKTPFSLSLEDLGRMPMTTKRIILICPGFFYDYLEWQGVPLSELLSRAGVSDYAQVTFTSVDGYAGSFKKKEVQEHLILVATRGNGEPLPRTQGFPARVVAEGLYGTRWVKYLAKITVE